ncbi:chromosome segregation protein SMC [Thalassotalea fusca]
MRLKHIKLSGFKSFVDPTKVPFEQQMTAIVGPNGCGKSNIIDAVRWVLGESSAKNLRGDAMTDVIFNGAASRKPVGQASVELVFDNIDSRIKGNLADRSQISVRRLVNRDGQNSYFLNGSKCRRRDITDIFLGTGLGPRSYAIIEQGTISRLIESKPQELRVFIEEAAGISKYKERRKETELRIKHTRENLSRLTDLRIELANQIEKLYGQAEAAKRFKKLKAQERKLKAELAYLRWQKYDQQHTNYERLLKEKSTAIESLINQQKEIDIALFSLKQQSSDQFKLLSNQQNEKLALTQKIAHAEQNTKHIRQHTSRLEKDNEVSQQQLINAQNMLLQEKEKVSRNQELLKSIQPQIDALNLQEVKIKEDIQELVQQKSQVEEQLRGFRQQANEYIEQRHGLQKELVKKEAVYHQAMQQLSAAEKSLAQLPDFPSDQLVSFQALHDSYSKEIANQEYQLTEIKSHSAALQQHRLKLSTDKLSLENKIKLLHDRKEEFTFSLKNVDSWLETTVEFLDEKQIAHYGSVQSQLTIDPGWEAAVQMVLAEHLSALWVAELPENSDLEQLFLIKRNNTFEPAIKGRLAEKVKGAAQFYSILNLVHIVESEEAVADKLSQLSDQESVITKEGLWQSSDFVRKALVNQEEPYLAISAKLHEVSEQIPQQQYLLELCTKELERVDADIAKLSDKQNAVEQRLVQWNQKLVDNDKAMSIATHHQQHTKQQKAEKLAEVEQLKLSCQRLSEEVESLQQALSTHTANSESDNASNQEEVLYQRLNETASLVENKNTELNQLRQKLHELALELQKEHSIVTQGEATIVRLQENIKHLIEQQSKAQTILNDNRNALQQDEENLAVWISEMADVEAAILTLQTSLAQEQSDVDKHESQLKELSLKLKALEHESSQLKLDSEGAKLRASSAMEQLADIGVSIAQVQETIPKEAKESQWQAQLIRITKDIANLGTINLAAIEEYESQLTRKNYLDQQDQDLNFAITTLESAIDKIDKESRQKFKATFDIVNKDLKQLFPKVFGGGQAYLELTGEDLLETGVTIMARPPGKKNSTIHLLSGGEKALTALSLVFAIFRLNPAPFCMLDEVDAPLDDANVERFCNLVKEMSNTVQFIYISHNKIAMEMATHLTGVTMFEPGVSRMVAVDIDEAIAMAEVS